jgi:hypothetical protein
MGMGQKDAVEPLDAGIDQLLAQIRRCVDEDSGRAAGPEALEEHRAAAAAILGVCRIACSPPLPDPRHSGGRAAAEDGQTKGQCDRPGDDSSLGKMLSVLARVAAASASGVSPRASATTLAVSTT